MAFDYNWVIVQPSAGIIPLDRDEVVGRKSNGVEALSVNGLP